MIRGRKKFANDLLFPRSRENVRNLLHKIINNWACAHNELIFFSMDRERLTIWLTLTCCVLRILVAMHDRCFAGEVGIHDNEHGQ